MLPLMDARPLPRTKRLAWLIAVLLGLGALFLFHGCHGPDVDHELFRTRGPERPWILD